MNAGPWWDSAAIALIAVVCVGLVLRHVLAPFVKSAKGGCGACSKCGPGFSEGRDLKP